MNAENVTVETKGEDKEKWDDISDADLLQSTQLVEEAAAQAAEKFNLSQGVKDVGPPHWRVNVLRRFRLRLRQNSCSVMVTLCQMRSTGCAN